MWLRYEGYRRGKEPLAAMAYFCLTVVEARGGRKKVAKELNIEPELLRKLGELSSNVGDPREARKLSGSGRAHTDREKKWLEAMVLALIRRLGEYDFDPTAKLTTVTMADLPNLLTPARQCVAR
jgi:hypothetical protein